MFSPVITRSALMSSTFMNVRTDSMKKSSASFTTDLQPMRSPAYIPPISPLFAWHNCMLIEERAHLDVEVQPRTEQET